MSSEIELETMQRNPRDADGLLRRIRSSSEMVQGDQDDDLEAGSNIAFCRICFDTDQQDSKLISPCMCKGTQQFVHLTCLDHWRSVKEGYAFAHCTTCRAQFHLVAAETEDSYRNKIKFRLFVARDVFLIFLAMQFAIGVIACAAWLLDKQGTFQKLSHFIPSTNSHSIPFYYCIGVIGLYVIVGFVGLVTYCINNVNNPRVAAFQNCCCGCGMLDCCPFSWPEACFTMIVVSLLILSILGIAYGFLVATFAFQRIWQRHFHILTKKELTKEYVVQDLGGSYFPPKLELEHEIRLKMLKLL